MAVFTPVSEHDLEGFLYEYDLPLLKKFSPIQEGVSNTNYLLEMVGKEKYILTLFEPRRVLDKDLPIFLEFSKHMNKNIIPTPAVIPTCDDDAYNYLCNRPAAIFSFLEGTGGHKLKITPDICFKIGELNARMHKAAETFECGKMNSFGLKRWEDWIETLGTDLNTLKFGLRDLAQSTYLELRNKWPSNLPRGAIHGDLFPDNVFFDRKKNVCGVIDFHFVCNDFYAYDLAITINAWCFDNKNMFSTKLYNSLLEGYESIRPLSDDEKQMLPLFLRAVALRFLLSRAEEFLQHTQDQQMTPKDPIEFYNRLLFFQNFMTDNNDEDDDVAFS